MSTTSPLAATSSRSLDSGVPAGPVEGVGEHTFRYWAPWLVALVPVWIVVSAVALEEPRAAFQENWPLFFVGVLGAVIGNATAVGGGLVFVPVTIWVYGIDAVTSLKLAIACQAVGMTSGAVAWWRRDRIPKRALGLILPAVVVGCLIGSVGVRADGALVKGLFGPVSCAVGLCTLLVLHRAHARTEIEPTPGLQISALLGGVLTAWVAIGIGEAIAAFLMLRHRVCAERAIALGVASLSAASICLLIVFSMTGPMPWAETAFMALGCLLGGRLAPMIVRHVSQRVIKGVFATVALTDGSLFIYSYGFWPA